MNARSEETSGIHRCCETNLEINKANQQTTIHWNRYLLFGEAVYQSEGDCNEAMSTQITRIKQANRTIPPQIHKERKR